MLFYIRACLLAVVTLPMWIGGALFFLFVFGPWTWKKIRWDRGAIMLQWRAWWLRRWPYATAVGYVVGHPAVYCEKLRQHERIHIRQHQDSCFSGVIAGGLASIWGGWPAFAIVWGSSILWPIFDIVSAAVLRNAHPNGYRGSERERSAYAQTWHYGKGQSWLERHRASSDGRVT